MEVVETNKERNFSVIKFNSFWKRLWWALIKTCPNCGSKKLTELLIHGNRTWVCEKCQHKVFESVEDC